MRHETTMSASLMKSICIYTKIYVYNVHDLHKYQVQGAQSFPNLQQFLQAPNIIKKKVNSSFIAECKMYCKGEYHRKTNEI